MKKNESDFMKSIPLQESRYNKRELYSKSIKLKRNLSSPSAELLVRTLDNDEFRMQQMNFKIKNMLKTKILPIKKNPSPLDILNNQNNSETFEKTITNFFNSTQKSNFSHKFPNSFKNIESGEKSNFNSANSTFSSGFQTNTFKSGEKSRKTLINKKNEIDDYINNLEDVKIRNTLRASISKSRRTIVLSREPSPLIQHEANEQTFQNKPNDFENEELKGLFKEYSIGHLYSKKEKQIFRNQIKAISPTVEKKDLFEKFMIDHTVSKPEKEQIISILSNKGSEIVGQKDYPLIQFRTEKVYQDVFKSYKKLKVNRQLWDNISSLITQDQIKKYENIYLFVKQL
jgi:hypothetical protein